MKKFIQTLLKFFAKQAIIKYKPLIIGITGSVGKSSTKEAIYQVLKNHFVCRRNFKNYNNEIGVPLTILGQDAPGKNLISWFKVFFNSLGIILFFQKSYPKILILEMAADHPSDIKYLTKIAPCNIGVVTAIGSSHLEFFKSIENVAKEKQEIISHLLPTGWAILNSDDERVISMKNKTEAKILTYGLSEKSDVKAIEIILDQEWEDGKYKIEGLRFKVNYKGSIVPVFLPNIIARSQAYSALAAIAVGIILDLNLIEISEALNDFSPLPGRMKVIKGINNSLIIDDTYNSSPVAAQSALETLAEIKKQPDAKKWAVLGDMLELGAASRGEHLNLGKNVAKAGIDYLVFIGKEAETVVEAAQEAGLNQDQIKIYQNSVLAGESISQEIEEGDIVLIKGSRGIHMEEIVKRVVAKIGDIE
ncbi:MAG: UDP-N-acetylmuramoyl-tripeptide--D-alanyl-D-alanine ligase [Patescibacteria group bacterium]|nr:UDP-N-acetylmuramoyl-tripeptide--D-alanyl-D-alanine ligase [Patescibacteria group bacterium]MDD5164695.1 UDP-N-acetylmuramoyl-tripeptide--D-alanyl-D-alanine ligase [Patescibacteria group bacterium]MDD5534983.1 UDP-N-acetylmuramoyl-tripeptide--D-alanyl-D-alanine ligase [Patescibacteria group bacterium]